MISSRQKGFTLIELLVVIAIIGILSAVVLASLNTARSKGNDASVKSNLDTVRTQSWMYYDISNRYSTVAVTGGNCGNTFTAGTMLADPNISRALAAAYKANGSVAFYCNMDAAGTSYAIVAPLASSGYWCTDSTSSAQDKNSAGNAYTATNGAAATAALTGNTDYTCN